MMTPWNAASLLVYRPLSLRTSTYFEKDSLLEYMKELESLPDTEEDFIDLCLKKYRKVKGFKPSSYGL
jgi:hypothetical protein